MTTESSPASGFAGMTVAAFESRMADRMAALITRYGGHPLVAPSLQEIPLENNTHALDFGAQLMAGTVDMLILLTGVGTQTLVDIWKTRFPLAVIRRALSDTTVVCRGPKPLAALKPLGVPSLAVPEPNTWQTILQTVDAATPNGLAGLRIAIQEYGVANTELAEALTGRNARVTSVPVYRWALPDDVEPLKRACHGLVEGRVAAAFFTSAIQVDHVVRVLHDTGTLAAFHHALARAMVASIGPTTSQRLRHHRFPVDCEPSRAKMGILVKEASEQIAGILLRKRHP